MNLIDKAKAAKEIQNHLEMLHDPNQPYFTKAQTLNSLKSLVTTTAHCFTAEDLKDEPQYQLYQHEQTLLNEFASASPLNEYFVGCFLSEQKLFEQFKQYGDGAWGFVLNGEREVRLIAKFTAPFDLIKTDFNPVPLTSYEHFEVAFEQAASIENTTLSMPLALSIQQPIETGLVYPITDVLYAESLSPEALYAAAISETLQEDLTLNYSEKSEQLHPFFELDEVQLQLDSPVMSHANSYEYLHYRDFEFKGFGQQGLDVFVWNSRVRLKERQLFIGIRENEKGCFHDLIAFAQFPDLAAVQSFYDHQLQGQHHLKLSQIKCIELDQYLPIHYQQTDFETIWFQHAQTLWSRVPQMHWIPLQLIQLSSILRFEEDPASRHEPIFILHDRPQSRLLYGQQRLEIAQQQQEQIVPVYMLERNESFSWSNVQSLLNQVPHQPLSLTQFKMIILESMLVTPQ